MEYNKDDDSLISAVYTDSGDLQELNAFAEEDEEAFRREIQAERTRVMKEFGIFVPDSSETQDALSVAEESMGGDSMFADSYDGILEQLDDQPASNHKTSSTPETYNNVFDDGNDEDSDSVRPNALFPTESDDKPPAAVTYRDMLTPGRLGIAILILSVIIVTSVAVAVGSFLANQENDSPVRSGAELPDVGSLNSPTTAPTPSLQWTKGDCMDHPNKKFNVNEQYGEQNCSFLQSNPDERDRMCLPENEGYRWCPVTCGVCQEALGASDAPSDSPSDVPTAVPSIREPTEEPDPRPVERPVPVPDPTRRPVADPTRRPVAAPVTRPVADPTRRPVPDPTRRPVADPTRRPVPDPTRRPVADPTRRPVTAPVANPRPIARPAADSTRSPAKAPVTTPVPDPTRSPVQAPVPTAAPEPVPVPDVTEAPVAPQPTESTLKPTNGKPPQFLCRVCRLQICEFLPC